MTSRKPSWFHALVLVASVSTSCAGGGPSVVQTRPEFRVGAHRIGVVGLFRNGRLDQSTWQVIASRVVSPLGSTHCDSAFSRALREAEPDTYAELDRRIKEEGLNNEALALLVPYTEADLLLIVDGRDPKRRAPRERKEPTDLPGRPVRSGHARNSTHRSEPDQPTVATGTGYALTASLYSVSLQKLVARIDTHDSVTIEGAADELARNMAPLVAGSSCARWKWLDHWAAPDQPAAPAPSGGNSEASSAPDAATARDPAGQAGAPGE
ncbi:MAG TPA: hypothetical protein VFQ35_25920 [Polyangiaceae bacterium]|nr:hypothetical protein [Polyangiaceae bacterium]